MGFGSVLASSHLTIADAFSSDSPNSWRQQAVRLGEVALLRLILVANIVLHSLTNRPSGLTETSMIKPCSKRIPPNLGNYFDGNVAESIDGDVTIKYHDHDGNVTEVIDWDHNVTSFTNDNGGHSS
jgi:hypothetical protein